MRRMIAMALLVCLCLAAALPAFAQSAGQSGIVAANDLNLREGPSTQDKAIGSYKRGTEVQIFSNDGTWCEVLMPDGKVGYMAAIYIEIDEETLEPVQTYTAGSMQQVGSPDVRSYMEGTLSLNIAYPKLGYLQADNALRRFVNNTQYAAQALSGMVSVNVAYDSYWVQGRYIGVLEQGEMRMADAQQGTSLMFALNVDTYTGAVLTYQDIFAADKLNTLLSIVQSALAEQTRSSGWILMPDALQYAVLMNDGVGFAVPSGNGGTHLVVLSYRMLIEEGLMAMAIDIPSEQAEEPEATMPEPETEPAVEGRQPMVAITFDDGPSKYTWDILDTLADNNAKATFFVVGNRVENYKSTARRIVDDGHEIATHTWSHANLTKLSQDGMKVEINQSLDAIKSVTGADVRLLRPPYGSVNTELRSVARYLGLTLVLWSVDTEDWLSLDPKAVYRVVMEEVKDGSIILCHDLKEESAIAMEYVIPELVARGYQLVTVSELLSHSETKGEAGKVYTHLDTSALDAGGP